LPVEEDSSLGVRSIRVPMSPGAQPSEIADAVAAKFEDQGTPDSSRDLTGQGDSISVGPESGLTLCLDDGAVGAAIMPQGSCSSDSDCDDGNLCSEDY